MAFATVYYVPTAVQAQAIASVGVDSNTSLEPGYTLTDGTFIPRRGINKVLMNAAYEAVVGDFIVLDENKLVTLWPAALYATKFQSTNPSLTTVTVQNSAGSVTRAGLTVTGGVVSLAATDAIVANGASLVLHTSGGTVSSGNATLNSPATAAVAAGVVSAVTASA